MTAAAVLFDLWQCGIQPSADPRAQHLLLPANKLTPAQRQALTECKAEVLELLTAPLMQELMDEAMKACDLHSDTPEARLQMRLDIWNTPPDLRADLLDFFQSEYGK